MSDPKILTTSGLARAVGVPEDTVRNYADRGLIPVQRDSTNRRLFNVADVPRAREVLKAMRGKTTAQHEE